MLIWAATSFPNSEPPSRLDVAESKTTAQIGLAFASVRVDRAEQPEELQGGMCGYLLPFVIVSVHLLVVLIGAAYMARPKRRVPEEAPRSAP